MAYTKQTWDTTSYVNPTRMNHIEDGIANAMTSSDMGYLGAKNLNSTPYFHGTSRTNNGVTFTVNADGSISTSGTATGGNAQFQCHPRTQSSATGLVLPNGDYILSGCPSGGSSTKYFIQALRTSGGSANVYGYDYGSGRGITLNGDDYSNDEVNLGIYINVQEGQNANGLVFRPMIRLKGDNDSSWQPYSMTNQEITRNILSGGFLSKGTQTNKNANDMFEIGIYRSNEGGISNCPTNYGVLVVLPAYNPLSSSYITCVQMFYASNGSVYSRINWSASTVSWLAWTQL